ncbi:MAG: YeeE/YedE family protein [Betaproteobacteria bacterium]|nr:YeeE/YedE family protein [Betaproteobacteria bacterium]
MKRISLLWVLLCGALFGFGLALATMVRPEVVLSFLQGRDYGLLLVLGGAAGVTLLAYQTLPRMMRHPLHEPAFGQHPSVLNARTLGGAALFGIGWGISGVCPGPAIAGLGAGDWPLLWAVAGMAVGAWVQGRAFGD